MEVMELTLDIDAFTFVLISGFYVIYGILHLVFISHFKMFATEILFCYKFVFGS